LLKYNGRKVSFSTFLLNSSNIYLNVSFNYTLFMILIPTKLSLNPTAWKRFKMKCVRCDQKISERIGLLIKEDLKRRDCDLRNKCCEKCPHPLPPNN
jgi:hypothetical protein